MYQVVSEMLSSLCVTRVPPQVLDFRLVPLGVFHPLLSMGLVGIIVALGVLEGLTQVLVILD